MAIQTGSTAWISLADSFESPRWREVAIVGKNGDWLQVAVRAKKPAETQGQLTAVEFDSKTFFLVEIKAHQLRVFGQEPSLRLIVDPAGLVKKASEVLDSDVEIIFASATEQESVDRGRKPKTSKHR